MKKIILTAAAVILALGLGVTGLLMYAWHEYEMPQIVGDTVENESSDSEEITRKWFSQYFEQFY